MKKQQKAGPADAKQSGVPPAGFPGFPRPPSGERPARRTGRTINLAEYRNPNHANLGNYGDVYGDFY